jgi:hypothetical protein
VVDSGAATDLAVFVDRLAAPGSDRMTAAARVQIRRAIMDENTPPGIRRLAEALAAGVDRAPAPRRSTEDAGSVAAAVRGNSLVVLDDVDEDGLAEAIELLLADGMRVMVTGSDRQLADRVRTALPAGTAGRVLDRLPALRCASCASCAACWPRPPPPGAPGPGRNCRPRPSCRIRPRSPSCAGRPTDPCHPAEVPAWCPPCWPGWTPAGWPR